MKIVKSTQLSNSNDWVLGGDFNEVRTSSEREGRSPIDQGGADDFNATVDHIFELETYRGNFTYRNGFVEYHMQAKLDQVFDNKKWVDRWPQAQQMLHTQTTSDHMTLILELVRLDAKK